MSAHNTTPTPPAFPNAAPRVSILIPNYNNGKASTLGQQYDLIGLLLTSIQQTLADDPTPFEILVYDDGSTDDSLDTLRQWSQKRWPDGRPFLELIEAPHCGILARNANILSRRARGDILARLDGDTFCLTPHWVSKLCQVFDHGPPRLGVVGPKQLRPDLKIHAFGDWILHPNGYTHIAGGMDRYAVRYPLEVDHVMGCFYCCKRAVFDDVGGYDETFMRGQTIDFGLRARLRGWTCMAVPHIEFIHNHSLRCLRKTEADTRAGVDRSLRIFRDKWGFCRLWPDLDEVRRRYDKTPLLWNARWFGAPADAPADPPVQPPPNIHATEWGRYTKDPAFHQAVDLRLAVVKEVMRQAGRPLATALIGCGTGLLTHILALEGVPCIGVDRSAGLVALAKQYTENQIYPNKEPEFRVLSDPRTLPLDDGEVELVLLFDQIEIHPNPVALVQQARRVLAPERWLVIVSKRKAAREDASTDLDHRFTWPDLVQKIDGLAEWRLASDPKKDDPKRDLILVAQRLELNDADAKDGSENQPCTTCNVASQAVTAAA